MMMLIEPTMEYDRQIRAYRKEFLDAGDSMDGTGGLREFENPQDWIEYVYRHKDPRMVPEGRVPSTQYMFVREEDRKVVGMIDVRHRLNDYLEKYGGHIGYSVAPSERRKGYAARMLKTVLPKCRELGITKVLITCNSGNEGSKRTILKNGGVYESTVYEPDEGVNLERYWIDLSE
ncbi:MAG: GNAT family N-acetyltransferase [Clostridiales bacterium]|nr:GNAT family N-acetyltransferase [Clostridiales bacterium]